MAGLESVGLAPDELGRLTAETDAALAGAPADPTDPAQPAGEPEPEMAPWSALTPALVHVGAVVVFPAWEIVDAEQGEIAGALGECMEQLFPGGIEGRYACWVRLIAAFGAITISRVQKHGRLPPLFARTVGPARGKQADEQPAAHPPFRADAPLQAPAAA